MTDFTYQEGTALTWAQMNENLRLMQAKYLDSANSAAISIAAANFKGNWSALTGALAVPAAVYHSSKFWLLLSNLADVTAATPGVSGSWLEIITGNVMGPASATDGHAAVFDGATGKRVKSLGAPPVAKTGDTMTGPLSVPAGASGTQVPRAQEVLLLAGNQTAAGNKSFAGSVLVTGSGGLGYGVGSGGTVTQATSKSTLVTLNKPSGRITTNNSLLAANSTVSFQLINSVVAAADTLLLGVTNSANPDAYLIRARCFAGGAVISIVNQTGTGLSDAIDIQFQVIKGATS